ncbi:hypothetical protein MKW94_007530 [Papaver nudicaule]|uniref:Cyclin-dependent kinase inhibitor domain-containing protein n=1 Tax=Papaver nudicaule TaxID=74823 RepID=A0AA41VKI6_PAPNU|nr:hypothetical protein [Papaver nudicaule]
MGKYMRKCKARISSNDHHHHEEQVGVRTRARTLAAMASAATATNTSTTTMKRKFGTTSTTDSTHELQSFLQLRSRKLVITTTFSEKPNTTPITSTNSSDGDKNSDNCGAGAHHRLLPCSSSAIADNVSHQHQYNSVSRCSSNGSSMLANNNDNTKNLMSLSSAAVVDLIEGGDGHEGFELMDNSTYSPDCRKRRETTPSSNLRAVAAEESGDLESTERRQITSPSPHHHHTSESMKERMASIESEIDDFFSVAEKQEQKRFSERYNFDFVRELPMEGRYEWVRLTE